MKKLVLFAAAAGMMFALSGCSAKKDSIELEGLNAKGCNNPKCQCPKPCQCGTSCRCGMNGNSTAMDGK